MYQNKYYKLLSSKDSAFVYEINNGKSVKFDYPSFEVNGVIVRKPSEFIANGVNEISENITELNFKSDYGNGMNLHLIMRVCCDSPIIRFKYILSSDKKVFLTKKSGKDMIKYFEYQINDQSRQTEIRISEYNYMYHSHILKELTAFENEDEIMGPILTEKYDDVCMLTAYEHGSQYPNKFIVFRKNGSQVELKAVKGNYYNGQSVDSDNPYETIWLQCGGVKGNEDDLAKEYRTFQLKYCCLNQESRKPYIFYNTWAFQERNKFYNGKEFLTSMYFDRIDKEIEVAHKMGIDVFVIDTGWYKKTGDWEIDESKFPDKLKDIKKKLNQYGMKLGLWFNPIVAAKTSDMYLNNRELTVKRRSGQEQCFPIWETEESYEMCLVSDYWKAYAERLSCLVEILGVSYFKWDAVGMYGCEMGNHLHGTNANSEQECEEYYAFNIVKYLVKIMDYVCQKHPEVIFDFDITEGGRCTGLSFLSAGKYFAVNNGPYYQDYDIEIEKEKWTNIFVNPGPARTWVCRKVLEYDRWIPSVLFLTHYLPDDGTDSQMINLASLILGQNGIWGDLLSVSKKGVKLFGDVLDTYKKVREDISAAAPRISGEPGETFEVHEKINPYNGCGVVALFANLSGTYYYKLKQKTDEKVTVFGKATVEMCDGQVEITVTYSKPNAAMVFFGA